MSDYLFEWGDNGMVVDGPMTSGVPIPRAPGNRAPQHPHHFPGLSSMALHMEDHNSIPNQSAGNSLGPYWDNNTIMTVPSNNENSSLSPAGPNSPSLWAQTMDLDLDIKMEPLDDLLGVDDLLPGHPLGLNSTDDNNLLDDVNLDDLLIPEQFPNSGMDQPNSPLTLMTVHPDEVMGVKQGYSTPTSSGFMNQQTITQPVKAESSSLYSLLASSFPPQGGGWRDPLLTSSSLPGQQGNNQLGSIEECPNSGQQQNMSQQQHCQPAESTSALQELLLRSPTPLSPHSVHSVASPQGVPSPQEPHMGQSVPRPTSLTAANPLLSARLSSSAPSRNFSFEQAWQRREPRQHLLSTGSLAEEYGGSASSLSTVGGILSPAAHDLSIDEGIDSEDESDNEHYDSESDNDSIVSEDTGSVSGSLSKRERFFWQYNVQAKGPKGHRVTINQQEKDPHNLPSVMDPVFSPLCSIQGIKHSGKARRGDGNDLTPNPRKLVSIGRELDKLNKTINDMTPVSELPFNVRPKSRKEKNKLASRACRLKKKAQHEANKIKLYGLEYEHKSMLTLVADARNALVKKVESGSSCGMNPMHLQGMPESPQHIQNSQNLEKLLKLKNKHKIAGHTTDFVNKVIENTQNGNSTGGLEDLTKTFSDTNLATSPSSSVTGGFSPH